MKGHSGEGKGSERTLGEGKGSERTLRGGKGEERRAPGEVERRRLQR